MSRDLDVGVRITADSKGLVGESRSAKEALNSLGDTAKRTNTESAAAAERFTANLKRQSDTLGMTASQVRGYDAAQMGLNQSQRASVDASNKAISAYESQQEVLGGLRNIAIAAGAAVGVTMVAGLKASVTLAAEAEQSHLRLAAVLRGTGHAAGLTKADLDGMAEGMKEKLGIDDDALRDSMAVLLTFRNVSKDSFGQALELSADLAAVMQTDLKSAVLQLGKALENPDEGLTALKRSGISFNETQKDMIKGLVDTGNQAEAMTLIMKTMKEQGLDGVAESMNQGITKATRDAGLAWDDLLKSIGNTSAVKGLAEGFFSGISGSLKDLRQAVESGDWLDRLTLFATGIKTPSLIAKINAPAAADDPQARATAEEGLARQKADQAAEIAAIAKKKADEEAAKAREEAGKRAISAAKAREEADRRAAQQAVDGSNRIIAALKTETEQIGLNVVQKKMMSAAAEAAKAPTKELAQEIMASAQAWGLATQQQEAMMAAEKERLSAIDAIEKAEKEAARASETSARETTQRWNNLWGGVEQTAKTSFIQFAAHGKSAMESIGASIKLSIIDVLYQLTVRKWIVNIGASLQGSFLNSALGSTAGSAAGGGSLLNIASMGTNAMSMFKGGFGIPSLVGRGLSMLPGSMGAFGTGMLGSAGMGAFSAAGGAGTAFIGGAGTAIGGTGMGVAAGMGSMAAAAAGPLAIAMVADQLTRMFAGNKTLGNSGALKTLQSIPILGSPINLLAGLFGHGPRKFRQEVAIGDVSAEGFDGRFTRVDRAKGGLLVGNKHWEYDSPDSEAFQQVFDDAIKGYASSAQDFAKNLGLSADAVTGYSKTIRLESEKGKTLTEEQINSFLRGIGNEFAQGIMPTVDTLKKAGEDAFDTLGRLSTEFTTLSDAATILGKSVAESRAFISGSSFEGRSAFIDAAGGADALNQKAAFFAQNFLTESERLAPAQEKLNDELKRLGLSTDLTKDQLRDLVQSFGKVNGVSEETLQALLNVQDAFVDVRSASESLAAVEQQRADAEKQRLVDQVGTAYSALQKSVETERNRITEQYNAAVEESNKRIQGVTESIGKLKTLSEALKSTVDTIRPLGRDQAKQQISDAINAARAGGELPQADSLKNALGVLGNSQTIGGFSGSFEFAREQAKTANLVADLGNVTDSQLLLEERSLAALEDSRTRLDQGFNDEMGRLDSLLTQGQLQIDALNGINTSVLSLADALRGFNVASAAAGGQSIGVAASGISYKDIRDFSASHTPDQIYAAAQQYGVSSADIVASGAFTADQITSYLDAKGLPKFAKGGFHSGGLRLVGERGPEIEATGPSRITSNNDLEKLLSNKDLVDQIKILIAAVGDNTEFNRRVANKLDAATTQVNGQIALRTGT